MEGRDRGAEVVDVPSPPPASRVETHGGTGFEAGSWKAAIAAWMRDDGGVDRRKGIRVVASGQAWWLVHCEG